MKYSCLGSSGTKVSKIALGTMMFGGSANEADSIKIIDCALDGGINFIDTADVYNHGQSEVIVGKALKGKREKAILATKVLYPVEEGGESGLNRRHIISGVEASLRRLDTDYIDIYYMHGPDYETSLEESLEAMTTLVKDGKIRYIGISNYAAWQLSDILALCGRLRLIAPVVTQNVYNLLARGVENELIPCLKAHNIGLTVYNPLAAGLLTGKYNTGDLDAGERFKAKDYKDRYWNESNLKAVKRMTELAQISGISMIEFAMKWLDQRQEVTSIISGVSRLSQMEQNLKLLEAKELSDEVLAECDDMWEELSGHRYKYNR